MPSFYIMMMKCPRMKYLKYNGVEGVTQFRYIRNNALKKYAESVFRGEIPEEIADERIIREANELNFFENIDALKNRITIESDIEAEGNRAYLGKIDGERAIFTISISKRFNPTSAYIALYLKDILGMDDDVNLAVVMPVYGTKDGTTPKIRYFPKHGLLNKDGTPNKRDSVGDWNKIRSSIERITAEFEQFINNTSALPDPIFGECGICPYHNVEIEFLDEKFTCVG